MTITPCCCYQRHPSLHFKRIGRFWSVRIGLHYRALAVQDGEDIVWFWIGHHAEYDRLIGVRYFVQQRDPCSKRR